MNKPSYIDRINAFWNWRMFNPVSDKAMALYFAILHCANRAGFPDEVCIPNSTLLSMVDMERRDLFRVRNVLDQAGLIQVDKGKKGQAATYRLSLISDKYGTNFDTNPVTNVVTNPVTNPVTNTAPYTDKDKDKDKDINNTVLLTQNSSAGEGRTDYQSVAKAYNETCVPPMPQVQQLSEDRKKHIKTGYDRLKKAGLSWQDYFSLVAASDFLMGRDGRWPNCGFDWLIGPKNMLKVLEGNYANRLPAERAQAEEKEAAIRAWEERHQ